MDNIIKVEDIDNMWKSTRTKMTKLENQVESLKLKMDELREKFSRPEPEKNGSEVSNVTLVSMDEKHISSHKGLKKFLDLNRYSLALFAKTAGNKEDYLKYKKGIDLKNLNKKQRFLISAPSFVLNVLVWLKVVLEKNGLQLSTYK